MSAPLEPRRSVAPLAIGVVALVLSLIATGLTFAQAPTEAKPQPTLREFTLIMGEGEIIGFVNSTTGQAYLEDRPEADEEGIIGEFHRWEPAVLVVNKGDTIRLTVKNPRSNDHSFQIVATTGDFSGTTGTGDIQGKTNSGTTTGTEKTIEFTANKAGIFKFICATPHDHENHKCDPDHPRMVGYIIVLG